MIHRMAGINRGVSLPVLKVGDIVAVDNKAKAELLGKTFQKVHSKENISNEAMIRRNISLDREGYKLSYSNENSDTINLFFSMKELKKAIKQGSHTTPGKDGLGYEVFQNLCEVMLEELLCLINTVWGGGTAA